MCCTYSMYIYANNCKEKTFQTGRLHACIKIQSFGRFTRLLPMPPHNLLSGISGPLKISWLDSCKSINFPYNFCFSMCEPFQICVLLYYPQAIIEILHRNSALLSTTELARHHSFNFLDSARKLWLYVRQICSRIKRVNSQHAIWYQYLWHVDATV